MALNSFDRRFEPEPVDVHLLDKKVSVSSLTANFEPLNQGVKVIFGERLRKLAEQMTAERRENERGHSRGCPRDGHSDGVWSELAVVALTGIPECYVKPPDLVVPRAGVRGRKSKAADVGRTLQVRSSDTKWLMVYPNDRDDAPFIRARVAPPFVFVYGWIYGAEAKRIGEWTKLKYDPFFGVEVHQLHDLCDLPEDNFAWLRSLPTGYLKQIQEKEQYEKEHVGEFQF